MEIGGKKPPAVRPDDADDIICALWELFGICWDTEPKKRPTAKKIRDHLNVSGGMIAESLIQLSTPENEALS